MSIKPEQGGAEQFPRPNEGRFLLPKRFTGMATREIVGEYPYVWSDNERVQIYSNFLFTQPRTIQAKLDAMKDVYLYPPDVASYIDSLLNFSTPAIQGAIQKQNTPAILDRFESKVLRIAPEENAARAWVSESGFTRPGRYAEGTIANALHTTPQKLRHYLGGYATKGVVIAQTGNFFIQIATKQDEEDVIRVGNTWEVNQLGYDLFGYLRTRYYPSFVQAEDN